MTGLEPGKDLLAGPGEPDMAAGPDAQDPPGESRTSLLPGLAVAAVAVVGSLGVNAMVPAVSPLIVALLLGAVLGNTATPAPALEPGLRFASRRLLRIGIVLLGVQLAVPDVLKLGLPVLGLVFATVAASFLGTRWLGLRLGLGPDRALLVATGVSICGAAAVTAMDGVTDSEREDVANAVAVVTLYGSVAMLVLPLLQVPLGLTGAAFGIWAGGSVHEVAQVVAAAGTVGTAALGTAVVVKLTRVVLLAPLIATVALVRRRTAPADGGHRP
ncbi:MAG: YeiH family protein, partial [Micromonosporaceae bacterium]